MTDDGGGPTDRLIVFAAGSLRPAFDGWADVAGAADAWAGGPVAFRYANARDLADAIEGGEPADVFASASPADPERLLHSGLLDLPVVFARNRVVIGVSRDSLGSIRSVFDLGRPGLRLAIEVAGVPLGEYTREAIRRLGRPDLAAAILANVVDQEIDVDSVVARVRDGSADAAFLYRTDVLASGDIMRAVELPLDAWVEATYVAGVIRNSERRERARSWLAWLVGPSGRRRLEAAGFWVETAPL